MMADDPKPDTAPPPGPEWTMLSVRLDPVLVRRIKVQAVLADRSIRSVVTEALELWIERFGQRS